MLTGLSLTLLNSLRLYSLYSHLRLREAFAHRQKWGMLAGVAGILLLCVR